MPLSPASSHGGSSSPVSVYLQVRNTPVDVHALAGYPIQWDAAYDNPWDDNPLGALPVGLGLSTAIDGTGTGAVTTTEAGTWAFTLNVSTPLDASWKGTIQLDDNVPVAGSGDASGAAGNPGIAVSKIVTYPAAASFTLQIVTNRAAAANPYPVFPAMVIVRLA